MLSCSIAKLIQEMKSTKQEPAGSKKAESQSSTDTERKERKMKRGYRPAMGSEPKTAAVLTELKALQVLVAEICDKAHSLPARGVSRSELKRDFGFSGAGILLLESLGWLKVTRNIGTRKAYELQSAVIVSLLFHGFANAPRIRVKRKRSDIATVAKETVERILREEYQFMHGKTVAEMPTELRPREEEPPAPTLTPEISAIAA